MMPKQLPDMMTSIRITAGGEVEIVDQLLLPHTVKWDPVSTPEQAFDAIKSMRVSYHAGLIVADNRSAARRQLPPSLLSAYART